MRRSVIVLALLTFASCGGDDGSSTATGDGSSTAEPASECRAGDRVAVTVFVDAPGDLVLGAHTRLFYPETLAIPGRADERAVSDRVRFVITRPNPALGGPEETFAHGTAIVNDQDWDVDGRGFRVQTFLSSPFEPFPDGRFVEVTFDCVTTIAWPSAADLACEIAGVADTNAVEVGALSTCRVEVAPPDVRPASD